MMLAPYRKLVVALAGLLVLWLYRRFAVDLRGNEGMIAELILAAGDPLIEGLISAATAFGIWLFPNRPRSSTRQAAEHPPAEAGRASP